MQRYLRAMVIGVALCASSIVSATDIHVDVTASEGGNGQAWSTAFKHLQDALTAASAGDIIWVANGTYYPDLDNDHQSGTGDPDATFTLKDDVRLLGGFAGDETGMAERDPVANVTILSGDLDEDDGDPFTHRADNSVTVVTASGNERETYIDAFTITGGDMDSNDEGTPGGGGGMRAVDAIVSVIRCVFTDNLAEASDTGIYRQGGGMWTTGISDASSVVAVLNCEFAGNRAEGGGGFSTDGGAHVVFNSLLHDNEATSTHISFGRGGATSGPVHLTNCTVVNNSAQADNGGIGFATSVAIRNCIVWGNTGDDTLVEDQQIGGSNQTHVMNTTIQGCHSDTGGLCQSGTTNDASNPDFVDDEGGNWRLAEGSPAEDKGSVAQLIDDSTPAGGGRLIADFEDVLDINHNGDEAEASPDLDLEDRIMGANIDRGPYERISSVCTGDVDQDGQAGFSDILAILAAWGSCSSCPEDLDGDGEVGFPEILLVLAGWGPCPESIGSPPASLLEEIVCMGLDGYDWADFMGAMESGSTSERENMICWIEHYYDAHCKLICLCAPSCPDDDPFGGH